MIEKMRKYSFVLYHLEYKSFLARLQELGLLHIIRNTDEKTPALLENKAEISEYAEAIRALQKHESESPNTATQMGAKALLMQVNKAFDQKAVFARTKENLGKQIRDLEPWGHFDHELVQRLKAGGINVDFFHCQKNHFKKAWAEDNALEIIGEKSGSLYFIVVYSGEKPLIEADPFNFHGHTLAGLEKELEAVNGQIRDIDHFLADNAALAQDIFSEEIARLTTVYDFEDARLQGVSEADEHLMILSGWIPLSKEAALKEFIEREKLIYFASDPSSEDEAPINLKNGWFASLFEPITRMYMLPKYGEFDLTPFLAPFFMLFFGFCNADMGYGLVIVLLAWFLKRKLKDETMRGLLSLVMFFGLASVIMGFVFGSLLAYDMKELPVIGQMILVRDNDQIFNLALLLGVIQILFGTGIAIVKKIYQSGFVHGLSTIGTFLFIASISVFGASQLGIDISAISAYLKYPLWAGLALIMLFNSPGKNIFINLGGGLWALYNIITGFFGDILSYIRLFALGVSSSILGFVINSIGGQMSSIPVVGPLVFLVFMLFGHSINIALGGLSGFVHPLRLTFIEFFNNADFNGPGIAYKPLSKS